MFRWLAGLGASRREVERWQAAISDRAWRRTVAALPFLRGLTPAEQAELRRKAAWLLASKYFSGAHGLEVTDAMALSIAAQAVLPILALDTGWYEGWLGIVVYPGTFLIRRSEIDEHGILRSHVQDADGEAWDGGPVILSWQAAGPGQQGHGNVVIHEFAHKLDLYGGDADGMPGLAGTGIAAAQWRDVLEQSLQAFRRALDAVERAIPHDVDPESEAADPWYNSLPLNPYASASAVEFFAVSSEVFFVEPGRLARWRPQWYALLSRFYRQDPLARLGPDWG